MKYISVLLLLAIFACNTNGPAVDKNKERNDMPPTLNDLPAPTTTEIEAATKALYNYRMTAEGGGGYTVSNVRTIKNEMGKDANHYQVQVEVSGIRKHPPLAKPLPDEPFTETQFLMFELRDGKWNETTLEQLKKQ